MQPEPEINLHEAMDLESVAPVVVITLARIYDMLTVIANSMDPATTQAIVKAHELGQLFGPPPALDTDTLNG